MFVYYIQAYHKQVHVNNMKVVYFTTNTQKVQSTNKFSHAHTFLSLWFTTHTYMHICKTCTIAHIFKSQIATYCVSLSKCNLPQTTLICGDPYLTAIIMLSAAKCLAMTFQWSYIQWLEIKCLFVHLCLNVHYLYMYSTSDIKTHCVYNLPVLVVIIFLLILLVIKD